MASLIDEDGVLFESCAVAPSPCKDFWQLIVTVEKVVLRQWKISLRSDVRMKPTEVQETYEDFLYDYKGQSDVQQVFGANMLEYVMRLTQGETDYLPRLPKHIVIHIIQFLELSDIAALAQVSKQFRRICRSNELWRLLYLGSATPRSPDGALEALASDIGWRRLYFTSKLQLQLQLRRQKHKDAAASGESSELTSPSPLSCELHEITSSPLSSSDLQHDSDDEEMQPQLDSDIFLRPSSYRLPCDEQVEQVTVNGVSSADD